MSTPGCAFCAHDGDAASYVPEDLSGLWRFKSKRSKLSRGGDAIGEDHRELLQHQADHTSKHDARRPEANGGHLERVDEKGDEISFVEVGATGEGEALRPGFCFSVADAGKGIKPPSGVSEPMGVGDSARWVCLDARDRVCDCESAKDSLSCSTPRSMVRVAVVLLFVCFCAAVSASACFWASRVDVGAWFARSKASKAAFADDQVAMATTFKMDESEGDVEAPDESQ